MTAIAKSTKKHSATKNVVAGKNLPYVTDPIVTKLFEPNIFGRLNLFGPKKCGFNGPKLIRSKKC